jgi:branched-chain amino acid transport system substrate-binding protein
MKKGGTSMRRERALTAFMCIAISIALLLGIGVLWADEVKEVKIGAVYPMSGFLAMHGKAHINGHNAAIDKVNAAGGIKSLGGAKLKLVIADTESKDENAIAQTERLIIKEEVSLILGSYGSGATFPASMIAEKYNTPILVSYSVADKITERGFKNVFRIVFKGSSNAEDHYRFLKWLGEKTGVHAKTVGLLYEDSLWGHSSAGAWKELADKYGFKIVADVSFPIGCKDFSAQILKLKVAAPDVVLELAYVPDGILITRTIRELGYKPKLGMIVGGHNENEYYEGTKGLNENRIVQAAWHRTLNISKIKPLNKIFLERFGKPIVDMEALAYVAALVAFNALERAGSLDRSKIREALTKTNLDPRTSESILHYTIQFDETGHVKNAPTCFGQVKNNEAIAIYPPEFAAAEPIWPAFK